MTVSPSHARSPMSPEQRAAKRAYDSARYRRLRAASDAAKPPDPITLLDVPTLAYLAGLTDADGSIYVTHTNRLRTYYPTICWAMTHRPTIDWAASILGDLPVYLHNHTNLRRGTTSWGASNFREQWRTGLTGARARLLCDRMLPYMRTKAEQATAVASFPVDERRAPGRLLDPAVRAERERLAELITSLNRG
jgi:hypothetical protein